MKVVYYVPLMLAVLLVSSAPSLVQAKSARTQPDPQVFDLSDPADLARRTAKNATQPACYTEPVGFHSQIRWDGDCVRTQQLRQSVMTTPESTRFEAPRGFKSQIRWD